MYIHLTSFKGSSPEISPLVMPRERPLIIILNSLSFGRGRVWNSVIVLVRYFCTTLKRTISTHRIFFSKIKSFWDLMNKKWLYGIFSELFLVWTLEKNREDFDFRFGVLGDRVGWSWRTRLNWQRFSGSI